MRKQKEKSRKGKATLRDLPDQATIKFSALYIPNVKLYVGTLPAWAEPDVGVLKEIWDNIYAKIECSWDKDETTRLLVRQTTYYFSHILLLTTFRSVIASSRGTTRLHSMPCSPSKRYSLEKSSLRKKIVQRKPLNVSERIRQIVHSTGSNDQMGKSWCVAGIREYIAVTDIGKLSAFSV